MLQFKPVLKSCVIVLLLALTAAAQPGAPNIIVSYSFDDDSNATGPDTFRVFNFAKGGVNLTTAYPYGGYRSVELRDVAADKTFPELQGYFPLRKKGKLFAHFALMTALPEEHFNIALAGPEGFVVAKDAIAFWLSGDHGILHHHSNSTVTELIPLAAFVWYSIDVAYDIDAGSYDLVIYEEGHNDAPSVRLINQPNAPNERGSSIDKFSFIGDLEDKSKVVYYVDDIVISTDRPVSQKPLIAPGRRKLFIDAWNDYHKKMLRRPNVMPSVDLSDFGIGPAAIAVLKQEGLIGPLGELLDGGKPALTELRSGSPNSVRLVHSVALWMSGNNHMAMRRPNLAFAEFEEAAQRVPEGKIFKLSAVLALAALKRWNEVDAGLAALFSQWQNDVRFSVACAMIGIARGNLGEAERWLRDPAALIATGVEGDIIRSLWNGEIDADGLGRMKKQFAENWRKYVESWLVSQQYFFVLLWQDRFAEAQQYAVGMSDRYRKLGLSNWMWLERAGDASFFAKNYPAALQWYQASLKEGGANPCSSTLLRLSDVYFVLGDLDKEKTFRERIYGRLGAQ